jgi:hypothetical protein
MSLQSVLLLGVQTAIRSKALTWLLVAVLVLSACGNSEENYNKAAEAAWKAIARAEKIGYHDLTPTQKQAVGDSATYSATGWMPSGLERFDTQSAAYVTVVINRKDLAFVSLLYSCGGSTYVRECSEETLTKKMADVLYDENPRSLYGKYMNSWSFYDGSSELPQTVKFEGYRLLEIKHESEEDELLIGPIPGSPDRIVLNIYYNLTQDKHTIRAPDARLKQTDR